VRRSCGFSAKHLQHAFSGHASDFGINGPWNKANADLFKQAIQEHIANASEQISATFRGTVAVTHYYHSGTHLWVAVDQSNTFVAGWNLYPSQVVDLLTRGDVK